MIEVDGSKHEGGGAILRLAAGLSAITGEPIKIFNIRKKRPVPGLRPQHLEGLKAVSQLSTGTLKGAEIGSTEIEFCPGKVSPKKIQVNIKTAGSIGLLFQSIKLLGTRTKGDIEVEVSGGSSFSKFAPPLLYTRHVLLPVLEESGYTADIEIERHGFYPVGGARVKLTIHPCTKLKPIELTRFGKIDKIEGISIASSHLKNARVAERQANTFKKILFEKTGINSDIKTQYTDSACPGSGIVIWAATSSGAVLGSDGLGERGKPAETVGKEAASSLVDVINSKAAVDPYLSDQFVPFMALASGRSAILTPELTDHAKTNIWLIKKFLDVDFGIEKAGENVMISCSRR